MRPGYFYFYGITLNKRNELLKNFFWCTEEWELIKGKLTYGINIWGAEIWEENGASSTIGRNEKRVNNRDIF